MRIRPARPTIRPNMVRAGLLDPGMRPQGSLGTLTTATVVPATPAAWSSLG